MPHKGVAMETLTAGQATGFWKLIKASLDGEKEGKRKKKNMKSDTRHGAELRGHGVVREHAIVIRQNRTGLRGRSVQPGC